jgi:hypothetical protein
MPPKEAAPRPDDSNDIHFLLTLGRAAGIHPAMNSSHLARRISARARRLSAGAWDMRMR